MKKYADHFSWDESDRLDHTINLLRDDGRFPHSCVPIPDNSEASGGWIPRARNVAEKEQLWHDRRYLAYARAQGILGWLPGSFIRCADLDVYNSLGSRLLAQLVAGLEQTIGYRQTK